MERIILALIILFASCESSSHQIKGVVTEVNFIHIGAGKSKQQVTYNYTLNENYYEAQETFYFRWQGDYREGDSIWIKVSARNPQESEIMGALKKPEKKRKIIKLESNEK
jgi:hypothetical protein